MCVGELRVSLYSVCVYYSYCLVFLILYYTAANKSIQQAAVQYILDTVVQELQLDSNRTFIYVEMAFFTRWWNQQDSDTQTIVSLVHKCRGLKITSNCMHALVHELLVLVHGERCCFIYTVVAHFLSTSNCGVQKVRFFLSRAMHNIIARHQ